MSWKLLLSCILLPAVFWAQSGLEVARQHIAEKNYTAAEKVLLKEVDQASTAELRDQLGEVYAYQERWDEAIDIYKELTENHPKNARYFFRYGGVLAKKAQNQSPLTAWIYISRIKSSFKTALKLDPQNVGTLWALVDLYVSLPGIVGGSYEKAIDYALILESISPLDGLLALGYVYEYQNEPQKAKAYYLEALKRMDQLKPQGRNQLNYQIGKISSEYGLQMERGIIHLKRYIEHYTVMDGVPPEWAYYRLARIYRKKSDLKAAQESIDKALGINPEFKPAQREQKILSSLE